MKLFYIISVPDDGDSIEPIIRDWWADDSDHAEEQHNSCISNERISWILEAPNHPQVNY